MYHRTSSLTAALLALLCAAPAVAQPDADPADDASLTDDGEPITRQEAAEIAVERNHDIRISRQRTTIAERNVSPGNAGLLPTLEATASQNHQFGGSGLFGSANIFTQTSLGVQLDWVMFAGFGRLATLDRLKLQRSVSQLQTEADVERTLEGVVTAYWRVVRQKKLLDALRETREVSKQRVDIAESRLAAGAGSRVDVNLARVELNQDRSAVEAQQIALTQAKTALNRELGRDADTAFSVDDELEVTRGLVYEKLREQALEQNRRLVVQQRQKKVAAERIDEVEAERWPTLSGSLGYSYQEFHGGIFPNFNTDPALAYGINLNIPLFRGFNVRRRIRNSRTERTVADIEIEREQTRIVADLKNAWEAYRRHLARLKLAEESVGIADENVDIALIQLEAGTITQVELRQVQLNLLDARTRQIDATFQAKAAEIRLRRLSGRLYGDFL